MKQAMILAAGLGTRLKPLTDTMPKALVPVAGRPLLDITIARLQQAGYDHFVINVHHFAQQIIEHVAQRADCAQFQISDETGMLLDTGGALKRAQELFASDSPILIHNVDILDNVDYVWLSQQHLPHYEAVLLVSQRPTKRYLLFSNAMRLVGWKNVDTGEVRSPYDEVRHTAGYTLQGETLHRYAFSGIHSFSPRLFPLMDHFPERFGIIDFYLSICHKASIMGVLKDDLQVLDVGKLETLGKAETFFKK